MIPKYDEMYLQVLKALADGKPHTNKEIADHIAKDFRLSAEEQQALLPSGRYSVFLSRVSWSITYLRNAGLIESIRRGHHQIMAEGLRVLKSPPAVLDNLFLSRYPSFQTFLKRPSVSSEKEEPTESGSETPDDCLEQAIFAINQRLADDLMSEILKRDSDFFEALVIKLLCKMGYGGSASDAGVVTQRSNDGGIDGIIREDKLGFDQIYIQAKRWDPETTVGRPEIQKFFGALAGVHASKGLFITTAKFSDSAKDYAKQQRIVLVDGERLTRLMIEYDLGVSVVSVYQTKTIDTDFFDEDFT